MPFGLDGLVDSARRRVGDSREFSPGGDEVVELERDGGDAVEDEDEEGEDEVWLDALEELRG